MSGAASWARRYEEPFVRALYLHVPFCLQKCAYCDFVSHAVAHDAQEMARYADVLVDQIGRAREAGLLGGCRTAYIGGGTPSMLGTDLVRLVRAVRDACPELEELTCEGNPESLSGGLAGSLHDAGATRFSVGVQSTSDAELRELGRVHSAHEALACLRDAAETGADVSCDLMCAIPGQTALSWEKSLTDVLACGVGHVSVYPLQIEEGTPLARRLEDEARAACVGAGDCGHEGGPDPLEPAWNSPDIQAERMEAAEKLLADAGFSRYEVASYARPGHACRHNVAYWTGLSYLGLGTSAASMLSRAAYQRLAAFETRLPTLDDLVARIRMRAVELAPQTTVELEYLDERQAICEDLMLGLRRSSGIGGELLDAAARVLGERPLWDTIDTLRRRGLIAFRKDAWAPTHDGWLLGNELFGAMWGLAPSQETRVEEVTL